LPISVYSPQVAAPATKVSQGSATVTTNERPAAAAAPVQQNADGSKSAPPSSGNTNNASSSSGGGGSAQTYSPSYISELVGNPLDNFASYAPLWTLAVLTPKQFNDPTSYRSDDASFAGNSYFDAAGNVVKSGVVFSSAGRYDQYRVNTEYGAPEYFVNNFVMNSVIAPTGKTGNSNAIKFSFDIFEPYSMGLLLQSLQNAAIKAGYASYLDNTPYLLRLDFVGYTDDGTPSKIQRSKFFTCKLLSVKFDVTESGSNYKVEAIPYNHQAFGKVTNTLYKDYTLIGGSIQELLATGEQSLSAILNKEQEDNVANAKNQAKANEYVFVFPKDAHDSIGVTVTATAGDGGATSNKFQYKPITVKAPPAETTDFGNNMIGDSDMGFTAGSGGTYPASKEADVYDEDTGRFDKSKVQLNATKRQFQFTQGQTITHIITQLILSSSFAKNALTEAKLKPDGTITWFKIDVQIQLKEYDVLAKDFAKKIIYRIVPYSVHSSVFQNPTATPVGYKQLEKKIAKRYDYIYTGQNNSIIKFDLQFNTSFFAGANPSSPEKSGNVANPGSSSSSKEENTKYAAVAGSGAAAQTALTGMAPVKNDPALLDKQYSGGSGDSTPEKKVAESFQRSFLNSGDMITCGIELIGDPYWMVDSGIGNYIAKKVTDAVTEDGTMTYDGSAVYTYITFRTPSDVLEGTGLMGFPNQGKVSGFSGIYKVLSCESRFTDGKFTQQLKLVRMPGQATDFNLEKQPAENRSSVFQVVPIGVVTNVDDTTTPANNTDTAA